MRLAALVVVAGMALPGAAHGVVTIGAPDLTVPAGGSEFCVGTQCSFVTAQDPAVSYAAPFDGVIVRWRVRAGGGPVSLRVFESVPAASPPRYVVKATGPVYDRSAFLAGDTAGTQDVQVPIQQGDLVGVTLDDAGIASSLVLGAETHGHQGPVIDGTYEFADSSPGERLLFNADIEPDADRDGFGDETQDLCPTDGTVHTACPVVVPPRPATLEGIGSASGGKRLVVDVECPDDRTTPCRGSVTARSSKRLRLTRRPGARRLILRFGEKRYSVPSGLSDTLRFRVTRRQRKVLVRLRRFGVTMTLDADDADPVKFKGTAKAPKRKRKPARR